MGNKGGTGETIDALIERAGQYREYADLARRTHYRMSDRRARTHQWVGGLAIIAAATVSTGFLSTINSTPSNAFKFAGGVLALFAAILAGFQTFYKFAEVGEQHRLAAASYGSVRRDLDLFLARYAVKDPADAPTAITELDRLADRVDALDQEGPGYPGRVYAHIKKKRREPTDR
jgi:hypothetical protein